MNKLSWGIVIGIACVLVYLIYLNRAHAKIQEAIIVAITGVLAVVFGVVFFGTKNKEIDKNIATVSFVSLEQKKPVFFTAPILLHYFMNQGIIWADFERNHSNEAKNLMEALPKNMDGLEMLADLQAVALIYYLGQSYHFNWDMIYTKKVLPGFISKRGMALNTDPKDKKVFSSKKLVQIFKQNKFCESLQQIHQLTLPKNTNLKYIPYSKENKKCQILISKRFAFEITITLYFSSYSAGIGKVADYIGLTEPTNVWHVNWEERDKFGTAVVTIECYAKFFTLKSGNPEVQRYKRWIENLFDNLYEEFDWSVCNESMREYNEELANQKIVSDLGRGFEQKKTGEPKNVISKQATINKSKKDE